MRIAASRIGLLLLALTFAIPLTVLPARSTPPRAEEPYVPPRGYVAYRTAESVVIDGSPGEAAWAAVPWSEPFVDIEGDRKPAPRFRTRVKMLWDNDALYIAAELQEPHVWGTLTRHDAVIFHDNDFEVFLDPDGDSHLYGELELNALNTTWDLLLPRPYKDGGRALNGWEIIGLRTAVRVDGTLNDPSDIDRGWTVEIAWPWAGLAELRERPVPPHDGDQWRINFSRVQWEHEVVGKQYRKIAGRREDNWVWSPQGVIDMHRPEMWGVLQFSTAKPGAAKYEPDPAGRARHLLHRVYYAQQAYRKRYGFWAPTLDRLGIVGPIRLEGTAHSFDASTVVPETGERWHITSDARVWNDAPPVEAP